MFNTFETNFFYVVFLFIVFLLITFETNFFNVVFLFIVLFLITFSQIPIPTPTPKPTPKPTPTQIPTQIPTNCVVSKWSDCSHNQRTRKITPATNGGTCSEVDIYQNCYNCVVSKWSDCSNNIRTKKTIPPLNGGLACPDPDSLIQDCSDCVLLGWTDCSNNIRTKRTIPPLNGGLACPDPYSLIQYCSDCVLVGWTECSNNRRTKIITPATNGGTCTEIDTFQYCSNCEVSEWKPCTNNIKIKQTIPPINGGLSCPDPSSLIQTCSDCVFNDWGNWSDCDIYTGQYTRTINKIKDQHNGGVDCPGPQTIKCDVDCSWNILNAWSDWSLCGNTGKKTRIINETIKRQNNGVDCPGPQIVNCPLIFDISGTGINIIEVKRRPPNSDPTIPLSTIAKIMMFTTGTSSFIINSGGLICDILMIGGGGAGGYQYDDSGGGGAGSCIIAIGHTLPTGRCNITVGAGGDGETSASGYDSSISVDNTTLYLAKGGGAGGIGYVRANVETPEYKKGKPGGCGGGAAYGYNSPKSGGNFVSTNIVNGVHNISPSIEATYAVLGNKGGDQTGTVIRAVGDNMEGGGSGGGGIGTAAPDNSIENPGAGAGGDGLNEVMIGGERYNFKYHFAENNTFGHNNNGYIGGGGSGAKFTDMFLRVFKPYVKVSGGKGGGGQGHGAGPSTGANLVVYDGAANTGSGGGASGSNNSNSYQRGSGGSGIVIIRYNII